MSCNRENITWQSAGGTWSRGFYDYWTTGDTSDPNYDYEWDVEYDYTRFNWVSTGHPTAEAANAAWDGSNPGSSTTLAYSKQTTAECAALNHLALRFRDPEAAAKIDQRIAHRKAAEKFKGLDLREGSRVKVSLPTGPGSSPGVYYSYEGNLTKNANGALVLARAAHDRKDVVVVTPAGALSSKVMDVGKSEPRRTSYAGASGFARRW